jgi:hypothetical protein
MKVTIVFLLLCYASICNAQSRKDFTSIGNPFFNLYSNFSGKLDSVYVYDSSNDSSLSFTGLQPLLIQHFVQFYASRKPGHLSLKYIDKKGNIVFDRQFNLTGLLLTPKYNEDSTGYTIIPLDTISNPFTSRTPDFVYDRYVNKQNYEGVLNADIPITDEEENYLLGKDVFLLYQLYDEAGELIGQDTKKHKFVQDISSPGQEKYYKIKEGLAILKEKRKNSIYFK